MHSALQEPRINLSVPVVVAVSPPEYGQDPAGRWWGFFQFPDLWRGTDGVLYLAINVGADSTSGTHQPTQFFASVNGAVSWTQVTPDKLDFAPEPMVLPDGSQVALGKRRFIYHLHALTEDPTGMGMSAVALGLRPIAGPVLSPYKVTEYAFYRYGDIPQGSRRFPVAWRRNAQSAWETGFGDVEMDDLLVGAIVRDGWWDAKGAFTWEDREPRLMPPVPDNLETVVSLPDGTLLWALASQNPRVSDRRCSRVTCLFSTDHGRTWRVRGQIAADTTRTSWGYGHGEQALARLPDGDLLCVMRTKTSNESSDTHYLAAARSADGGFTWTTPEPLAAFCVTPHLLMLENGMIGLVYGRPGVHVKASADSGRTWSETEPVVGPAEKGLLAHPLAEWWAIRHDFSCANTSVAVTGPDRFLVAYSDFQHTNEDGQRCKAIKVRTVQVVRGP